MKSTWKERLITARVFARNLGYLARGRWLSSAGSTPVGEFHVPDDFFGICVASSPDTACDDYIVTRLRELGIRCVRVDVMPGQADFNERFLRRLFEEKFRVCLHIVQPPEEVRSMANQGTQARWRTFLAVMLDTYGTGADLVEIGSTCNRRKWSGHTVPSYLLSWQIAWDEANRRNIPLAGPNVTDFEPVYNIAILGEMKRLGMLPAVHTNNLFVERATEPEAFDHKIMGRPLAGIARFNLIKKARLLNDIAIWAGIPATVCSHVSWSLRRIARLQDDVEEKQANYVARYCCLAAASGALKRVFWGPMIGQREGLIDDGTSKFPDIPHVTFYGRANGHLAGYRPRPAFLAFQTVNRFIAGTTFKQKHSSGDGLEMLEFVAQDRLIHVVWTRNGHRAAASNCYESDSLHTAGIYSRDGVRLNSMPPLFAESPIYLTWPTGTQIRTRNTASIIPGIRFADVPGTSFSLVDCPPWKGAALAEDSGTPIDITALVEIATSPLRGKWPLGDSVADVADFSSDGHIPDNATSNIEHRTPNTEHRTSPLMLRDDRNRVWSVPAPWNSSKTLIIKRFKPRSFFRRLLDWHKPDKAQRSWNGSQELIRRGIRTPLPVAFFHQSKRASVSECYFICQAFDNAASVREAFTALSAGATQFSDTGRLVLRSEGLLRRVAPARSGQNKPASELFDALAHFLGKMHERGVFFRDLSAGNLLFRPAGAGGAREQRANPSAARQPPGYTSDIEFALIDTARARFYPRSLGLKLRLCDLMRICHPLHWQGREAFVGKYMSLIGRPFSPWMKTAFIYYDWKHRVKNALKPIPPTVRAQVLDANLPPSE